MHSRKRYNLIYTAVIVGLAVAVTLYVRSELRQMQGLKQYGEQDLISLKNLTIAVEPGEEKSAGETTVKDTLRNAFGRFFKNISNKDERWPHFRASKLLFERDWSNLRREPSIAGPFFSAVSCKSCHERDGRGRPPLEEGVTTESLVFQLSVMKGGLAHPHPEYGEQLSYYGADDAPGEGDVEIKYRELDGHFADGETFTLLQPEYSFINLTRGPLGNDVVYSPRVAPAIFGLGLLEIIPENMILANADPDDHNNDGISGRPNYVRDIRMGRQSLGRFGWKASQPTVEQQVASAFFNDIGVTSRLFPGEAPFVRHAGTSGTQGFELSDARLDSVLFYMRLVAAPARRGWNEGTVLRGKAIFQNIGCAGCHTPSFQTGDVMETPEMSRQTIRPYTDLLLHDMGEALADNRPDGEATGREWRTAPLWGIGMVGIVNLHTRFLHDGRARNLEEAVLWHGGEAESSRDLYRRLRKEDRSALLKFLESL